MFDQEGSKQEHLMLWFIAGAGIGIALLFMRLAQQPGLFMSGLQGDGHPVQGILVAAVMGAAIFGTVLWLVFG